jgi:mannose-6-phosphate isomerase-like protein (cupin superfamily)
MAMIEKIEHDGRLLALIIRQEYCEPGIHFFTPDDFSQQLAYMRHPPGKVIEPHFHNYMPRQVQYTQEVLVVKRGKLRVDIFSSQQEYLESYLLQAGDVILLAAGGHGFEALEEIEMIEIKQGPFTGEADKTRFDAVPVRKPSKE